MLEGFTSTPAISDHILLAGKAIKDIPEKQETKMRTGILVGFLKVKIATWFFPACFKNLYSTTLFSPIKCRNLNFRLATDALDEVIMLQQQKLILNTGSSSVVPNVMGRGTKYSLACYSIKNIHRSLHLKLATPKLLSEEIMSLPYLSFYPIFYGHNEVSSCSSGHTTYVRRATIISDTTKEHRSVWEQGVLKD